MRSIKIAFPFAHITVQSVRVIKAESGKSTKSFKILVQTFFLLLAFCLGNTQEKLEINAGDRALIGKNVEFFVDSTRKLEINDVLRQTFTLSQTRILNLGNIPHNVWMRFSASSKTERDLYLEIMQPLMEQLELYEIENGVPKKLFEGGMNRPFKQRPIISENWIFNLGLTGDSSHTYYIKGHSGFPFQIPMALSSKAGYAAHNQEHNLFWGLYIGIILFAFIYNFFIYLSVREKKYLLYILYILGSATFYLGLQGFSYQFIWPNTPYFNFILPLIICITNSIITLFTMDFLVITKKQKWQYYFGWGMIIAYLLIGGVNLGVGYPMAAGLAQMLSLVSCIFFIIAAVSSLRRKVPNAKYFLLAWTLFLVFVFIYILTINNVIPSNFFTTHCIFIGHMTEVGLLSFALADRINWLKSENVKKQKEIIYQLEQNEQIQLEANRVLEQKVVERTAEVVEQKNEAVKQRKRSDELLLNILPSETAEELKSTGTAHARHIDQATVLFTDMKDFTQLSEKLSPEELVAEINEAFCAFDRILEKHGVEKIKTIGDSYMAAGGLPTANTTHAVDVVNASLDILKFMKELQSKKKAEGKIAFEIRVGVHTGPVVAGIVGLKKFAYDIWGDTVNIASRMESSGEVGKVNISASTYNLVKDRFTCTHRGKLEAKHKGMIDMYFVEPN